jgi:hypothetical protein
LKKWLKIKNSKKHKNKGKLEKTIKKIKKTKIRKNPMIRLKIKN